MKVLLTGPSGAVGQYVLEALMPTGLDVRVLALPDSMHRINYRDRIEMIPGELADSRALDEALADVEFVYHTALVSPPPRISPEYMAEVNVEGTRNLLRACTGRIRRLVMCSSNNVYTPHRSPAMWPLLDDALREAHGNPQQQALGETLIHAEDLVFEAAVRDGLEYAILRPTVIAGRKCPFVDNVITNILQNPASVEMQRRMWDMMQWCHGSDIASAALLVADDERARNQCFLVAGAEPVTAYDVQSLIWEVMNVGRDGNPFADIAARNNIGLAKFEPRKLCGLGWRPKVGMKQCIREVLGRLEFYSSASLNFPAYLTTD